MLNFLLKRFGVMILTALCMTLIVFVLTNLRPNLEKVAKFEGTQRMTDEQVENWLESNGYNRPMLVRYGEYMGKALTGDFGRSIFFRAEVGEIVVKRLGYTGILMFWVMVIMVPLALIIGVLSGMREGSGLDRSLSTLSIMSTSTPEYVMGPILIILFASSKMGLSPLLLESGTLLKGTAASAAEQGISFQNFTLPVATMVLYGMGYIARMTRASMAEVMTSQYIRTARLKGVSFRKIVLKHALRNALIAPFTVIMLQFPWLLTGVVIVESLFNYKGFGWLLWQGALNNDINLVMACSVVSVFVVLITQLISDIGYAFLNPRIRVS